jgi:ribosomal protein L19E
LRRKPTNSTKDESYSINEGLSDNRTQLKWILQTQQRQDLLTQRRRDDLKSAVDEGIARVIQDVIKDNSIYGYRMVWTVIRFDRGNFGKHKSKEVARKAHKETFSKQMRALREEI